MTACVATKFWAATLAMALWLCAAAHGAGADKQAPAASEPAALTLHYQDRPPYSSLGPDGLPRGLLITPLVAALRRADIGAYWELTPGQRQLGLIQSGAGLECGVGWFRSAEREALGRFSRPIYQDRPFVALVRADKPAGSPPSVASLLTDPAQVLLVKQAYSYGVQIDALLQQHRSAWHSTSAENAQMARMLAAGRASWMIIAPEEAELLLASITDLARPLRQQALHGVGPGPNRHLYCNKQVPAAWLQRIDQALEAR